MKACPSSEQLACFLGESLGAADSAALENHVEACADCQHALAELSQVTIGSDSASRIGSTVAAPKQERDSLAPEFLDRIKKKSTVVFDQMLFQLVDVREGRCVHHSSILNPG